MPSIQQVLGWLLLIALFVLWALYEIYQKSRKDGERNTLRIIKNFLQSNGYKKQDYLLVNNLIIQKAGYWSCEIDILLLTKKWIYVIEVKDWKAGMLKGNFNDEYWARSWKIRKGRKSRQERVYSPFFQNETHVKRLKNYFPLTNQPNILSIVVFNSPELRYNLKRNKKLTLQNRFTLANNSIGGGIADILTKYEKQDTRLNFFEQLRKKIGQVIITPDKIRKHRVWVKSLRD